MTYLINVFYIQSYVVESALIYNPGSASPMRQKHFHDLNEANTVCLLVYSQVQVLHNINIFIYYSVVVFMSQNIWLFVHDSKAFCSVLLSPSLPIFLAYLVLRCRDKITQINVPLLRKAATFASKTKHTRVLEHALDKETKPIAFLNQIKVNQLGTKTILWLMLLVEL